jgi:hypothetical protein
MKYTLVLRAAAMTAAIGGSACISSDTTAPATRQTHAPTRSPLAIVRCVASIHSGATVQCAPKSIDRQGVALDVIVGRQNIDVTLAFSGTTYSSGTGVFSTNATVTNLMNQPLGTTNGTTASPNGTRVFFTSGPDVSGGTGTVTLSNADGVGVFTASNQPYFQYSAIIQPSATSATKTWTFQLTSGVTNFTFFVEVDAPMPAEGSIRHWTVLRQGLQNNALTGVWQASPTNVWAVGLNNTFLQNTGSGWSIITPTGYASSYGFQGINGTSATDYWAVASGGHGVHYNGSTWTSATFPTTKTLRAVWGGSPTSYFAVGDTMTLVQYNGSTWSAMTPPVGVSGNIIMRAIWGSDNAHVFAVGDNGTILSWNGLLWLPMISTTTQSLLAVWGTSATNVFAVGTNGVILQYTGGLTWSAMTSPTTYQLNGLGGSGPSDIWAVGDGGVTLHYNGTSWSQNPSVTGVRLTGVVSGQAAQSPLYAVGDFGALMTYSGGSWTLSNQSGIPINSIWADSPTDVWVSSFGSVLQYNGTSWTSMYVGAKESTTGLWGFTPGPTLFAAGQSGNMSVYSSGTWAVTNTAQPGFNAVWGSAANNVYAVGTSGAISRYNGTTWANQSALTTANLFGLWGTSASNIYAVGASGQVLQYNGASWSSVTTTGTTVQLNAVAGSSAIDVWVVGASGTILQYNGTAWSAPTSGTVVTLRGVWANVPTGSYTADVYAVGDNGTVEHGNGVGFVAMPTSVTTALNTVFATSSTNVYVGGANGVVLLGTQ